MKLLALDTATELCSAALWIDGRTLARAHERPRGSGELILQMIEQLLAESDLALSQLDAIAFGRGPGAFTGVRLAAAVAQGLGFACTLPLLPISDLRALAQRALAEPQAPDRVLVCQDARMAEVYWACYERHGVAREATAETVSDPSRVALPQRWLEVPVCGAGSGFEAHAQLCAVGGLGLQPIYGRLRPRALEIAELAAAEGLAAGVAPEAAQPVYLRDRVAAPPSGN